MDRKSIIVLVLSFALLGVIWTVVPKLFPPLPRTIPTNAVSGASNGLAALAATNVAISQPPITGPAPTNVMEMPLVRSNQPEVLERIESPDAVFTFTSHGGGLKTIELKKYPEDPVRARRSKQATNELVTLNARTDVPVLVLRGSGVLSEAGEYKMTKVSSNTIRAEKLFGGGLVVVKEFTITGSYVLKTRGRIENRSSQPVSLPEHSWSAGTASSASSLDDPTALGAYWFNGAKGEKVDPSWFVNSKFCMAGEPRSLYLAGANNVCWAAVHNQFFAIALVPGTNDVGAQILVSRLSLAALPAINGKTPPPFGYEAAVAYPGMIIAPGQGLDREFMLYAGPKEYTALARLGQSLDLIMDFGFFGWFAKALLVSMNALYKIVPDYGLVIILITVIIKLLFWPLTQASTRSMKRMQALQPQMKALQEKYKEDPAKMNKKLMEFMKENKVSPMGGCLPMLLQIPVFIGFYTMIRSAIELRGAHFLWAADLSRSDTVAYLPGLDFPINPLPLIMGVTMLWQARMTPPTPGVDPTQQKIMKYMPMIFMFMLYNFSAGLTLYWTVQNLLTIAQMKLTKTQEPASGSKPAPVNILPAKKKKHS